MATLNATLGEYRLVELLGEGGMGKVYRAVHSQLGRVVAIKILKVDNHNRDGVERFLNEARIQANLHHPHIAALHDFSTYNGRPCIIMEYVDGRTLAEVLAVRGFLPLAEVLPLLQAIVAALGYIHQQGVLHRDLKPNNIKVATTGVVKLLDFGIAKTHLSPKLTKTGRYIGTLPYLAPEILNGKPFDPRADIWSLGVVLYELLTGQLPFEAATIDEMMRRISSATFTPASMVRASLPPTVDALISRCLRVHPKDRYQSMQKVQQDLSCLLPKSPIRRGETESFRFSKKKMSLHFWRPLFLTAPVLAILLIVGLWGQKNESQEQPPRAVTYESVTSHSRPRDLRPSSTTSFSAHRKRRVWIDVIGGQAAIYQDDKEIGQTPFALSGTPGERLRFVLKRPGYKDKEIIIDVLANDHRYTELMEKAQSPGF